MGFVEMRGITKYFPGTIANENVDLTVDAGQVLALLGENGAGKTTLMKILYGMYRPDEGSIAIDGVECDIKSPQDAMELGIGMIHQHFSLVPVHSVAENLLLGLGKGLKPLNLKKVSKEIYDLGEKYGLNVDPSAIVGKLPVGMQQRVEILKALYRKAKILIMDEPTAVLTPQETEKLFHFVSDFRAAGHSVIFITHKLGEVMAIADKVTVMRNGRLIGSVLTKGSSERTLAKMMVGKDLDLVSGERATEPGRVILNMEKVSAISDRGDVALEELSLQLRSGEILGIAGVSGNGQQELSEVLCGLRSVSSGSIELEGVHIENISPQEVIERGIGYIPADRHKEGLVLDMSIEENLILKATGDGRYSSSGLLKLGEIRSHALRSVEDFSIKTPSVTTKVKALSGGNQQKVVIAREIATGSKMLVAFQPIRGLDLGAADYVHSVLMKERSEGKAILLISTELSEVLTLSDRIGVIYRGKLLKVFDREKVDMEKLGLLMAGVVEDGGLSS